MDMYESVDAMSNFHTLPYSYFENPTMFTTTTAPMQSVKPEMHQFQDLPPALISSGSAPSIPSASSSTVGSPYSGPSHTISSQDGYDHTGSSYGLGVLPTIVNHDTFSHDMMGNSMEAELAFEKLPDSFVGECADLSSSQTQLRTVAHPKAQFVQPLSSSPSSRCLPFTASPKPLCINTLFDRAVSTVPSVTSTSVFSTAIHSPATEQTNATPTPTFKSPTTPASARSRQSSVVSPAKARAFPPKTRSSTGPAFQSHMLSQRAANFAPLPSPQQQPQPHVNRFQSHFFAQSSGNFMPPLESSCSSLPLVFPFLPCHFPASSVHP